MTNGVQIESGVPLPEREYRSRNRDNSKYPWTKMAVGQSFFVSDPPKYFSSMVAHASRVHQRKFSYRVVEGGIRVWRVA